MGLIKRDGYQIEGVDIAPAYLKIMRVYIGPTGGTIAHFGISTTRENLDEGKVLKEIPFNCTIDKNEDKIYKNIYNKAKQEKFVNWEDDIPEKESI